MASKRSRLFYVAGHTCFSMVSRRSPAMRHCRLSHQGGWLICPQLSCFTLEITASPVNKKDYIALEKLDQNLVFLCLSSPFFLPSAPDLCFSHKFRPEWKNTRCWVKSQVTLLESERERGASQRLSVSSAESKNNSVKGPRMFFFLFSRGKKSRQLALKKKKKVDYEALGRRAQYLFCQ